MEKERNSSRVKHKRLKALIEIRETVGRQVLVRVLDFVSIDVGPTMSSLSKPNNLCNASS